MQRYACFLLVLITLMIFPVGADRLSQDQIERLRSEALASRSDAFLVWQDGVLLVEDAEDLCDFPVRLAGRGKLDTFSFSVRQLGNLLVRERPQHFFQVIIDRLANDLEFLDMRGREIKLVASPK
mgnify:CR=1 FL=1